MDFLAKEYICGLPRANLPSSQAHVFKSWKVVISFHASQFAHIQLFFMRLRFLIKFVLNFVFKKHFQP